MSSPFVANQSRRDKLRVKLYNRFRTYREGLYYNENDPEIRDAPVALPLSGLPDEVFVPDQVQRFNIFQERERDRFDLDAHGVERFVPANMRIPWRRSRRMKHYFAEKHPSFVYKKTLGWGGNGMAAAFDQLDANGKPARSVVVKMLFSDNVESMEVETDNLQIFKNAEHILQLLYHGFNDEEKVESEDETADPPPAARPRRPESSPHPSGHDEPPPRRKKRVATGEPRLNCFVTEMLENGDLAIFLAKVRAQGEQVPNAVLWRFFVCLIRMCIGLAYPPDTVPSWKEYDPPHTEEIPDEEDNMVPRRIVHFDFDPRNIFIGDIGGGEEHNLTPILKLGDFGLTTEVEYGRENFYYEQLRYYGKRGYYAPEQFCADWDYIEPDDGTVHQHRIAGNYGAHTNLWAVGYVMETLITLCYPASPPLPTLARYRDPPHDEYYTYGAHLLADDYVDEELLHIIMRLQAHEPTHRLTLRELEDIILTERDLVGMTERQVLAWFQKVLHDVPVMERDEEVERILAAIPDDPLVNPYPAPAPGLFPLAPAPPAPPPPPPPQPRPNPEIIGTRPEKPWRFNPLGPRPRHGGAPGRRGFRARWRRGGRWVYNDELRQPALDERQPEHNDEPRRPVLDPRVEPILPQPPRAQANFQLEFPSEMDTGED